MEKNQGKWIALIITAFIAVLFGAIAVQTLAEQSQKITNLALSTNTFTMVAIGDGLSGQNRSVNTTNVYTFQNAVINGTWRADDSTCAIPTVTLYNSSSFVYTADTDYVWYGSSDGSLTLLNTTKTEAMFRTTATPTLTASFKYCPAEYVSSSWGRTLLNTTLGLFAIGVFAIGIFFAIKMFEGKDE